MEYYLSVKSALELVGFEQQEMWRDPLVGRVLGAFMPEATLPQAVALTFAVTEALVLVIAFQVMTWIGRLLHHRRAMRDLGNDAEAGEAVVEACERVALLAVLGAVLVVALRYDFELVRLRVVAGSLGMELPEEVAQIGAHPVGRRLVARVQRHVVVDDVGREPPVDRVAGAQGALPPRMMRVKYNGDSVAAARLRRRCAAELERLDPAAVPANLKRLVATHRSPEYRDGVLDGYAFAKLPELLVAGPRVGRVRRRQLELHFSDRHVTGDGESFYRAWRVVVVGESLRLSPVDFAFYACLVRRRLSGRDFVKWNTQGLRKEFEDEYRRVTNPMDSIRGRVLNGLARRGGVTQEWFRERTSRVNTAIGRLGEGFEERYGIAKRGSRPNTSYGIIVEPRCIRIRDGPSVGAVTGARRNRRRSLEWSGCLCVARVSTAGFHRRADRALERDHLDAVAKAAVVARPGQGSGKGQIVVSVVDSDGVPGRIDSTGRPVVDSDRIRAPRGQSRGPRDVLVPDAVYAAGGVRVEV